MIIKTNSSYEIKDAYYRIIPSVSIGLEYFVIQI